MNLLIFLLLLFFGIALISFFFQYLFIPLLITGFIIYLIQKYSKNKPSTQSNKNKNKESKNINNEDIIDATYTIKDE